nr:ATP-binding cassette sub-family B member 8, mitochondrial [Onthophagus taurus]XP_022903314.1 ATP-binding cassette sub-family B member 8, mitochondrial [Onthophagus taurus]XP_022903315.1 ATP-binding cassette sub-family B member 8, mitochondrial [Onthophagus taurus]
MWKLFNCTRLNLSTLYRSTNKFNIKSNVYLQRNHFTSPKKCTKPTKTSLYTFPHITNICLVISGGSLVQIYLNKVDCDARRTRMSHYRSSKDDHLRFNWSKFWSYLKPHIWYLIAAIIGALFVAILNIQIPQLIGQMIDVVNRFNSELKDGDSFMEEIKVPALKLIGMYLGQSVFTFFYIYMLSNLGEKIAYHMKNDLFASIIQQDIAFFDEQRTGEIINRLTTDIQEFKSSFKQTISSGLRATTQIIGCSISLFLISPQMTFFTLLFVPSVVVVGTIFGAMLRKVSRRAQGQIEKTTAVADEAIANIRTVRAFAMEDQEIELFDEETCLAMQLNQKLGLGIGLFQAGTNLFLNGMVLSTLCMGGYLLSTAQLSGGDLMAFLVSSQTIQRSLGQMSLLFGAVIRGTAAGARVFEYIDLEPKLPLYGGETIPSQSLKGEIEFKNVTFVYPSRPEQIILNKFNLKIRPGSTVALVGASGSGKSTVVALIERFYDVNSGSISIDGINIKNLDPSWLRQNTLGLISQEPILFGTTILENIRYGKPGATDDEVKEAAKLANAHNFITSFPKGYETMVGERGATLSGGQKQRVAIARALLKNPSILVLDEATSALDAESEKIVQSALENASKGRTVLVVAHRLSTIKNADLIVVLSNGHIIEMGTHEELLRAKGYYWTLVYQQQNIPGG